MTEIAPRRVDVTCGPDALGVHVVLRSVVERMSAALDGIHDERPPHAHLVVERGVDVAVVHVRSRAAGLRLGGAQRAEGRAGAELIRVRTGHLERRVTDTVVEGVDLDAVHVDGVLSLGGLDGDVDDVALGHPDGR